MHNKTSRTQPFQTPSTWSPKSTFNIKLEDYLEATKFELAHIRLKQQTNNMTKKQRSALLQLKNNNQIVIKPYDKGRGICIMNTPDYLAVGFRHLSSQHYQQLEQDITQDTSQLVHNVLTKMANQNTSTSTPSNRKWCARQCTFYQKYTKLHHQENISLVDPLSADAQAPQQRFLNSWTIFSFR